MSPSPASAAILQATNLSKHYTQRGKAPFIAVERLDLTVERGQIMSLLGPNGAGKTTSMMMLSGLVTPSSGDTTIGGYSVRQQALQAKALLGLVPQEIALYENLSARKNLQFFGQMQGKRGSELQRLIDEVLDFVDLRDRQDDPVKNFSGGMKRRVNIAAGLLHKPQLVFMDEPTVGIDPQNRRRVLDMIMRLRDELGMSVLYTSHLMEEVQELSDCVTVMDHGRIIAQGSVRELIQQIGEADRLQIEISNDQVSADLAAQLQARFSNIQQIEHIAHDQGQQLEILARDGHAFLPSLLNSLQEQGVLVRSIAVQEPNLEAVFLALTGRALRD
jgi:ABC-2 type transport system ATP-binding protein